MVGGFVGRKLPERYFPESGLSGIFFGRDQDHDEKNCLDRMKKISAEFD